MTKTRTIQIISTKEESLTSSFVHPVEHPKYIVLAKLVKHAKCIFKKNRISEKWNKKYENIP